MVKLSLKEQVYEIISDNMPEDRRDELRLSWEEIDDYDKLEFLGFNEVSVLDLATHLESVFEEVAFTELEIDNWVIARDVFESVENQLNESGLKK